MPSSYGRRRGLPDYDRFRTGLTFRDVQSMLYSYDPDPATWRHLSRGVVLGAWHQIKQEMWEEATSAGR